MQENEFEVAEFQLIKPLGNNQEKITNYAVAVNNVREIIQLPELTEAPKGGKYELGVFTSRDKVTPLIFLSKWLGLSSCSDNYGRFVIVIEDKKGATHGFLIDKINRIHRISTEHIEKTEDSEGVLGAVRLEGRLVFLLDFESIVMDINSAAPSLHKPSED